MSLCDLVSYFLLYPADGQWQTDRQIVYIEKGSQSKDDTFCSVTILMDAYHSCYCISGVPHSCFNEFMVISRRLISSTAPTPIISDAVIMSDGNILKSNLEE